MKRAIARLGARTTARPVAPPSAAARSPEFAPPVVRAPAAPAAVVHADGAIAPPPARSGAPGALTTRAQRAGTTLATAGHRIDPRPPAFGVRAVAPPAGEPRGATVIARAPARRPARLDGAPLRTQRRTRIPWGLLPRPRLAAAWAAVQREHGAAGELSLVGVYGPLALDAVAAAGLDPDGRLAVTVGPSRRPPVTGDIALARVEPGRRLVRCDLPYPAPGRHGGGPR